MRLIKFGSLWLAENNATDDFSLSMRVADSALRGGSFDGDGAAVWPEARTFTRSFELWNTTAQTIQEQMDLLKTEVARGRRILVAETRDGDQRQTWAKCVGCTESMAPGGLGIQGISATFRAMYPYWTASEDEPYYFDDGNYFDGGWYLDSGNVTAETISTTSTTLTITNNGSAGFVRGVLSVTAGAGEGFTNLHIRNKTNSYELWWNDTLAANETLRIDFNTMTAEVDFVDAYAGIVIPASQMDWMRIEPGVNNIVVNVDSVTGTPDLRWEWARHYL